MKIPSIIKSIFVVCRQLVQVHAILVANYYVV